jgi:YVTN family beta-propeller protein
LPRASVPAGLRPIAVAVSPDGTSVYVLNFGANTASQFNVGAGGALAPKTPPDVPTGVGSQGLAISPDGKSVYVTNAFDDTVSQYDVGPNGVLRPKTTAAVAAGHEPVGIAVTPRVPVNKGECINGRWATYPIFKSQRDCIAFVERRTKTH